MTSETPTLRTEILAGLSTFLAAFYIIIVNPAILSDAGMPFGAVVTATVLVASFGSLMMGLYAKNPIVVAPGMGINAFFTYSAVIHYGLSYQEALGTVFWSGVIFLLLSFLKPGKKSSGPFRRLYGTLSPRALGCLFALSGFKMPILSYPIQLL